MLKTLLLAGLLVFSSVVLESVYGHGRMLEPPGRGSMWRFGYNTPRDYNDNQVYCGGLNNLWFNQNGSCGVCGDPYQDSQPRDHEAGGKYGKGIRVRNYIQGQIVQVQIELTAYHGGSFQFSICPTNDPTVIASQTCMDNHRLRTSTGELNYVINRSSIFNLNIQLPPDLTCTYCVFRWKYLAAQNVGMGKYQEHFYSCADVQILPRSGNPQTVPTTTRGPVPTTTRSPVIITRPPSPTTTKRPPTNPVPPTPTPTPYPPNKPLPKCPDICKYSCDVFKLCNLSQCTNCIL